MLTTLNMYVYVAKTERFIKNKNKLHKQVDRC